MRSSPASAGRFLFLPRPLAGLEVDLGSGGKRVTGLRPLCEDAALLPRARELLRDLPERALGSREPAFRLGKPEADHIRHLAPALLGKARGDSVVRRHREHAK